MAKVTLNDALKALQGKVGGLVFKKVNGKIFVSCRAEKSKKPRTPKQQRWNDHFRAASQFALSVKNRPELLAFYQPIAQAQGCRMREVILSDAFSSPKIAHTDLSRYVGQPGAEITVSATDNFGVIKVYVRLRGADGQEEFGYATQDGDIWRYITTRELVTPVKITLHAEDRPGNHATVIRTYPESGDSAPPLAAPSP